MHLELCFCERIIPIETQTKVLILMHPEELTKPSSTGNLAGLALTSCSIVALGDELALDSPASVLFPGAQPLTEGIGTLVVPDGTWRQAKKMLRQPGLESLPKVGLPKGQSARFSLRKSHDPERLCTLEAIAGALSVLEGDRGSEVQMRLEQLLGLLVERTLKARGQIRSNPEP